MHIIAGQFHHRKILSPKGDKTRPTSSRLRETVFNICQQEIEGAAFLDICAGSGAMGLEALSRGAISACFIDNNMHAVEIIKENIKSFGIEGQCKVIPKEAMTALKLLEQENASFNICYIDPPYHNHELLIQILTFLDESKLLAPQGVIFVEDAATHPLQGLVCNRLILESKRKAGDSTLYVFRG